MTNEHPTFDFQSYHGCIGTKLAQGVVDHVRAVPEAWMQSLYVSPAPDSYPAGLDVPACGSAACLAGWATALHLGIMPREMTPASNMVVAHDYGSEYAAFVLRVDQRRFHTDVYTVTENPEKAIKAFCELTGAVDPGWSDDLLERKSWAMFWGFLPMLRGKELAAAMLHWLARHPHGYHPGADGPTSFSLTWLAIQLGSGRTVSEIRDSLRRDVYATAANLLGVDEYTLTDLDASYYDTDEVRSRFAQLMDVELSAVKVGA